MYRRVFPNALSVVAAATLGMGLSFSMPALAQGTTAVTYNAVASGDASTTDAVVWTRAINSSNPTLGVALTAQVSSSPSFSTFVTFSGTTDPAKDYTLKIPVTGLTPGTRYFYRFIGPSGEVSGRGTFKTAPSPLMNYPLHFAFSGDCDGLIRPYALTSQIPAKQLDFFMFDGDTEYETSSSLGSPAVTSTGNIPDPTSTTPTATGLQLFTDFSRKYLQQLLPVNAGGQAGLVSFFAGQGNYTAYDNHELGNKQYINGGAPAGGPVGSTTGNAPFSFSSGAGVDARLSVNDVNTSGTFMNKTGGFLTLQQVFSNYQPIKDRGTISAPMDQNTDGTRQLYFAQQWGKNAIFINTDCRSYRDIRMKTAGNADETGSRADNSGRTYLGKTQFAWLKQTLLAAQQAGTTWKFINVSDPIDQVAPIGGNLTLLNAPTTADYGTLGTVTSVTTVGSTSSSKTVTLTASPVGVVAGQPVTGTGVATGTTISSINANGTLTLSANASIPNGTVLSLSPAASSYSPVSSDGGKAWFGGYRAERNALLKYIADNQITNVVFLATDDHQNRVNEVLYSPSGRTGPGSTGFSQSDYKKVPYCFEIVCGPLGATGPDLITNHTFALVKKLADSIANAQSAAGVEPIGLNGYPGLHDVTRVGDPAADTLRQPADFYSPDTFNYNILDLNQYGTTLQVTSKGINSTVQNSFLEYDPINNPEQTLFSFQIDAFIPNTQITRSGFVYDRRLNRVLQQITVTNNAAVPLVGPINLALDNLSPNPMSLTNAMGTTANLAPLGSPYITVSPTDLAPGASATVVLQFLRPTTGGITYNLRTLFGPSQP